MCVKARLSALRDDKIVVRTHFYRDAAAAFVSNHIFRLVLLIHFLTQSEQIIGFFVHFFQDHCL